jgi:hypothetical protein
MRLVPTGHLIAMFVLSLNVGCSGGGNNSSSSGQINIAGNWQLTFVSIHGSTGTASGTLAQSASSFSGTLALAGAVCAASAPISGTVSGTNITATLTENGQAVDLTGTVAPSGQSASGTYTAAPGGCTNGDSGTWSGSDPPVSGSFVGALNPVDRLPVRLVLDLKDADGEFSGSASFTNSACLTTVSVMGKKSGPNLELQGASPDGMVVLQGIVAADGKLLTIRSQVSGSCAAESGAGILTKVQ